MVWEWTPPGMEDGLHVLEEEKRDPCVWSGVDSGEGCRMRWEGSDGQGSESEVLDFCLISLNDSMLWGHFLLFLRFFF